MATVKDPKAAAKVAQGITRRKKATKAKKAAPKVEAPKVEVTIDQADLCAALKVALDFTQKPSTLPVLEHVSLEAKGKYCTLTTTDLDTWWTRKLPFKGSEVKSLIPADILYKEVKALGSEVQEVVLTFTDKAVSVNGRCSIVTLNSAIVSERPAPQVKGEKHTITALPDLLAHVVTAASTDETRYNINCINFDFTNGKMVATDGHRLHYEPIEKLGIPNINLPIKPASMVVKHKADRAFVVEGNLFKTALAGGTMTAHLSEGDFPDYPKILGGERPIKVNFSTEETLKVLEGAVPLADKAYKALRIKVNGKLSIGAGNEAGSYSWDIPCTTKGKTKDIEFGVSAKYLLDAIKAFSGDTIKLELSDALGAMLVNEKAIVMPCRL